jgi:hypothetical protein
MAEGAEGAHAALKTELKRLYEDPPHDRPLKAKTRNLHFQMLGEFANETANEQAEYQA